MRYRHQWTWWEKIISSWRVGRNSAIGHKMPKRRVKNIRWEAESERMVVTLAMKRLIWKGVVVNAKQTLEKFAQLETEEELFYELPAAAMAAYHLKRYS